jgi:hypothetical protein
MRVTRPNRIRRVTAGAIAALAVLLPVVALAAGGPSAKLSRTTGNGLKLVMRWSAGIDYFDFYLANHKHQKITNVGGGCYSIGSSTHIGCTLSGQKSFTLKFTVKPRYPSHQKNKLVIGHRTTTRTLTITGP